MASSLKELNARLLDEAWRELIGCQGGGELCGLSIGLLLDIESPWPNRCAR